MKKIIEVSCGKIHTLATEEGRQTLVLLHGIPGSAEVWRSCLPLLEGYRLVVPDLPGFGSSEPVSANWHAPQYAKAIEELLDALEIRSAIVVGHDFGGPVAVALAMKQPERVEGLVLSATNLRTDTPLPGPLGLARIPGVGELLFSVMFSRPGLAMLWKNAVVRRDIVSREAFVEAVGDRGGVQQTKAIFLNSLRNLTALYDPLQRALGQLQVPTTVVWGDRDPFFGAKVGRRTATAIPGAQFELLTDCGHFVPLEQPERFCAAVDRLAATVAEE